MRPDSLLCIDCEYCEVGSKINAVTQKSQPTHTCMHAKATKLDAISLVTGPETQSQYSCEAMRAGICGVAARYYVPREA